MGDMFFYGGLAGMGISLLFLLILLPVFREQRKRLRKKIEEGEEQ